MPSVVQASSPEECQKIDCLRYVWRPGVILLILCLDFPHTPLIPYPTFPNLEVKMEAPLCPYKTRDNKKCAKNCQFGKSACHPHRNHVPENAHDPVRMQKANEWVEYCANQMQTPPPGSNASDSGDSDSADSTLPAVSDPAAASGSGLTPPASAVTAPTPTVLPFWQADAYQAMSAPTVAPRPRRQQFNVPPIDAFQVTAQLASLVVRDDNKNRELTRLGRENALLTQQLLASRHVANVSPRVWTPELGDSITEYLLDHINRAGSVELDNLDTILNDDVVRVVSELFNSAPLRE